MPSLSILETVKDRSGPGRAEVPTHEVDDRIVPLAEGRVVIVSDGRVGHLNQCLGLAEMLGVEDPEIIALRSILPGNLAKYLPVAWGYDLTGLSDRSDGVVLGAGWQVSRVVRWLKRRHPKIFTVQTMRPSGSSSQYDLVVLPLHDSSGAWGRPDKHVVRTFGMLNRVRAPFLDREWARWRERLAHCCEPRLAVLLGGDSKHGKMTMEDYDDLADSVLKWAGENGGSLLVSASRRTPEDVSRSLRRKLEGQRNVPVSWWSPNENQSDNPYYAFLAGCQGAVATADSLAMLSEVATAGKPLSVWGLDRLKAGKFRRFTALLERRNLISRWDEKVRFEKPAAALSDTEDVARIVRERYSRRAENPGAGKSRWLLILGVIVSVLLFVVFVYAFGTSMRSSADCPYTGIEKLFLCGKS